jgi:hypothetical protein
MRDIRRSTLTESELSDPVAEGGADLFRSDGGFEILLKEEGRFPTLELRGCDGAELRVIEDEDGSALDEETVSTLLWERLETFDAVIDRLAGPLPDPEV